MIRDGEQIKMIDGLRDTEAVPVLADIVCLVLCATCVVSWGLIGWLVLP